MIQHIIYNDRQERWLEDDKFHKVNIPAHITPNGIEIWYKDNKPHRKKRTCSY